MAFLLKPLIEWIALGLAKNIINEIKDILNEDKKKDQEKSEK